MRGRALNIEASASLRSLQKAFISGQSVDRPKTIQRPGLPARPGCIGPPALLCALPQKLPTLQVKNPFVGRAAVAAHQHAAGGQAVPGCNRLKRCVFALLRGVKDNAHIHHNIDEQAVFRQERAHVLPLLFEAQAHCSPGLDQHVVQGRISAQVVPALVGRPKQKAQVMHISIQLTRLDQAAVMLCPCPPFFLPGMLIKQPQLPAQEPLAPVRPALAIQIPLTSTGVHGKLVGVLGHQAVQLARRENKGLFIAWIDAGFSHHFSYRGDWINNNFSTGLKPQNWAGTRPSPPVAVAKPGRAPPADRSLFRKPGPPPSPPPAR